MDKEKEIEEMAMLIFDWGYCMGSPCSDCQSVKHKDCFNYEIAKKLYNAGYRKTEEVTLKLDLGDRTPKEINKITKRLSKAMSTTPIPVISLSNNEIRRQAVMEFAEELKKRALPALTELESKGNQKWSVETKAIDMAVIDTVFKEKYGK